MRITDNIYIQWCNPFCFTLGLHGDRTWATWIPEDEEPTEDDFEEMNILIIGFLFFQITFLY